MSLSVNISFTPGNHRKMLKDARDVSTKKPRDFQKLEEDEYDDDDAEDENDKLVALSRQRGDSKPPEVLEDDLPDGVMDKYRSKKKARKGNGKKT